MVLPTSLDCQAHSRSFWHTSYKCTLGLKNEMELGIFWSMLEWKYRKKHHVLHQTLMFCWTTLLLNCKYNLREKRIKFQRTHWTEGFFFFFWLRLCQIYSKNSFLSCVSPIKTRVSMWPNEIHFVKECSGYAHNLYYILLQISAKVPIIINSSSEADSCCWKYCSSLF